MQNDAAKVPALQGSPALLPATGTVQVEFVVADASGPVPEQVDEEAQVQMPPLSAGGNAINLDAPFYGPTNDAADFWISYRRKLTDRITWRIQLNVDNLFDEYPPQTIDGYFSQANTDPQVYRVLGRTLSVSGRYRF